MKIDIQRRNKQRQRMVIFSFGLFMLLYAASKNPNLPKEWTDKCPVNSSNTS